MNKKFQRALSSALAFVMLCSCMMVMNVSSVMAADHSTGNVTTTDTKKTWDYSSGNTAVTLAEGDTFDGITVVKKGSGVKIASSNLSLKAGSQISIPVPANSAGTLTIYAGANQPARTAALEGNSAAMAKPSCSLTFTTAETADGDLDVSFAGGEFKPTKFEVTLTTGTFGTVQTYTLDGACSGLSAGTVFELTNGTDIYDATVNADGISYTVSTQAGAFDTTKTYTATLANYTVAYDSASGVTLTEDANDKTKFNATPAITFSEATLTAIPAGTYGPSVIEAGKPNFDISTLEGTGGKYKGTIKFILSETATVTVNGKCTSTTADKLATVAIGNTSYTSNANDAARDYVFSDVAAGETSLVLDDGNTSTTFQITSITVKYGATTPIIQKISGDYSKTATYKADDNTYYAIALIKADEATANSELSLNYNGTALEGTATKTVYDKVSIGGIEYTADKFGGNAGEYLYAVEIKNDGTDDSTTLADRVKAIGRTLVSATATPAE